MVACDRLLDTAILTASALSYLGIGTQPPTADWGTLLSAGWEHVFQAWSEIAFPGPAVCLALLGINLFGDGFSDALNPGLQEERCSGRATDADPAGGDDDDAGP